MQIKEISILIPTYNCVCLTLVKELQRQAASVDGLNYEVVVVDDESSDKTTIEANKAINDLPHCRFIADKHHDGRSSMRNALVGYGRYDWQIQIDCSVSILHEDFISRYTDSNGAEVVCGGIEICCDKEMERHNLRAKYEKHEEKNHTAMMRAANRHHCFRTTNFMYHRSVVERVPFDERIKTYAFEDVMFGRDLAKAGIDVCHIDNPVAYTRFEESRRYLRKTEESLLTLHSFEDELHGYSTLLTHVLRLRSLHLTWLVACWHRMAAGWEERNLCGKNPSLLLFKLYKLGYYCTL